MAAPALRIQGLWKEYSLGEQRSAGTGSLYDALARAATAPWRRLRQLGGETHEAQRFWALRGIELEIPEGEVVGVIGRNGAGKSTLLKILSRITPPTRGHVEVRGRTASLLEVGTGFHPELSGRENIFLNGAIMGMKRREVARKFDEIVAFAEVERFIDTAVKHYSSGMYVRLAFAVAAFLEADVLVVDEVLAVGDAAFQEKCLAKMQDVSRTGRTVLFVSHNIPAVSRLCRRGVVLDRGGVTFDGEVDAALRHYTAQLRSGADLNASGFNGSLMDRLTFESLAISGFAETADATFLPEEPVDVHLRWRTTQELQQMQVVLLVYTRGHHVFSIFDSPAAEDLPAGRFVSQFAIPPRLLSPGAYTLGAGAFSRATGEWMFNEHLAHFSVVNKTLPGYDPENMGLLHLQALGLAARRVPEAT